MGRKKSGGKDEEMLEKNRWVFGEKGKEREWNEKRMELKIYNKHRLNPMLYKNRFSRALNQQKSYVSRQDEKMSQEEKEIKKLKLERLFYSEEKGRLDMSMQEQKVMHLDERDKGRRNRNKVYTFRMKQQRVSLDSCVYKEKVKRIEDMESYNDLSKVNVLGRSRKLKVRKQELEQKNGGMGQKVIMTQDDEEVRLKLDI